MEATWDMKEEKILLNDTKSFTLVFHGTHPLSPYSETPKLKATSSGSLCTSASHSLDFRLKTTAIN